MNAVTAPKTTAKFFQHPHSALSASIHHPVSRVIPMGEITEYPMAEPISETMRQVIESQVSQVMATFSSSLDKAADLERLKRKEMLSPPEVHALYGLNADTMETWRCRGRGPDFIKVGKLVFYRHEALQAFINSRRVKGRV